MSFFTLNKVYNSVLYDFVLYDSAKTHAWDFFTYELKCCQLIRLQYSLIINISGKNQSVENFLYLYNLQRKVTSKITTFGWLWAVVPLVQSDYWILDHQYLCKQSIDILVFCMELVMRAFGWLWPIVPLIQSDWRIL